MEKNTNKMDLSREIDLALAKEEFGIPIYTAHLKNSLYWSAFSATEQKKINASLDVLHRDSRGHIRALKKIKKIEKKYV